MYNYVCRALLEIHTQTFTALHGLFLGSLPRGISHVGEPQKTHPCMGHSMSIGAIWVDRPFLAACASEKKETKVASRQLSHFRRCDPWADRFNELLHPWGSRWRYNLCEFGFHQFNYHSASVKNDLCLFFTSAAHVVRHHALIWYSLTFDIREKLVFLCIYPLEATRLHGTWVKQRSMWRQVCEILKLLTNISVQPCSANATDTTVPAQQNLCHLSVHMHAHRPFIKLMHGNSDNLGKTLDYA